LTGQITDLNKAIIDLEKMIDELDCLMKKKRSSAFKKIRQEFIRYSAILFGGGTADMKEIFGYEGNGEEALEQEAEQGALEDTEEQTTKRKKTVVGIDININPPGKKIHAINSLSGGERTLASIALICAVLSYNPAPFIVLDEVEAALDEINTRRFSQIVSELACLSQFIIITHNRVTMHASDALYGVTMSNDGMSKLLSVKLNEE
jgi:chromosome segregation protein